MTIDWNEVVRLFASSVIGGGTVAVINYLLAKRAAQRTRTETRVDALLAHLRLYAELTQLYRFQAYFAIEVVEDETGQVVKDDQGRPVVTSTILEPEPRFKEAIAAITGTDLPTAVTNKIASIRMASAEANDLANELDSSGTLKQRIDDVYLKTVHAIETVLKYKNTSEPGAAFSRMVEALNTADQARRDIRVALRKYIR